MCRHYRTSGKSSAKIDYTLRKGGGEGGGVKKGDVRLALDVSLNRMIYRKSSQRTHVSLSHVFWRPSASTSNRRISFPLYYLHGLKASRADRTASLQGHFWKRLR